MPAPDSQHPRNEPAPTYGVEFFYETPPLLGKTAVLDALRKRCPDLAPVEVKAEGRALAFEHREHVVRSGSRDIPMRTLVGTSISAPVPGRFQGALAQSWGWPYAVEVLSRCRGSILLTDVAPTGMDHRARMVLFENTLAALLEASPAVSIHWQPTQQFVRPREFLAAFDEAGGLVWMPGPINVRLFRMEGEDPPAASASAHETLMDTLGLAPLGLPDVECHFRDLDSAGVSRVLYNTAIYLAQQGCVLEDGHTVPGLRSDEKWTCRHVRSLALPDRLAIRLDPGPDYAAE
jgi:hypothetical protein